MNYRKYFYTLTAACFLLSCSVYKSSGRKSFEDKSSGNVPALSALAMDKTDSSSLSTDGYQANDNDDNSDCWNQPTSDPLWQVEANQKLTVESINAQEIKVCVTSDNHSPRSSHEQSATPSAQF